MAFEYTLRKLKKLLYSEKIIADRGADRFATGRVKELTEAIEVLSNPKTTTQKKIETTTNPKPLTKKTQLNIKTLFKR